MKILSTRTGRVATSAVAAILVLLMSTTPALSGCCMPAKRMTSMHAAMKCCGPSCKMTMQRVQPSHDYALTKTTAPAPLFVVASIVDAIAAAPDSSVRTLDTFAPAFGDPPPFLAHHQFRI